jgi:hydrogenase nickel incorporation protein HypA/HybF
MHELSLMESVVSSVDEKVGTARVAVVRLEVGRLAAVVPEALRFCFGVCARDTSLENAALEIQLIDGRGRCGSCHEEQAVERLGMLCRCGSAELQILSGLELRVTEVEVE